MPEISVNGVEYSYMLSGEGSPMLLLHGFSGSKDNWESITDHIKGKHKGIEVYVCV